MKNYHLGLLLGGVFLVTIVVTNIVAPHAFPDDRTTIPFAWGLIAFVLLLSGYRASRRSRTLTAAIRAGAAVSVIGFIIAMVTFLVIDNIFLNIVSQQSDKIWNFQHSTFPTMQAMINHDLFFGLLIGIPMSAVFGGICGAAGSFFASISQNRKVAGQN